jgi:hypothetical protein
VDHQIGPERQWGLKVGGTKGIVHGQQAVLFVNHGRHGLDIGEFESGIGGGFHPAQPRRFGNVRRPRRCIVLVVAFTGLGQVDKIHCNTHGRTHDTSKISLGTTVHIVDAQHMIATVQQMHHGRRGGTAGTVRDAVLRRFRGGHGAFQRSTRGIAGAGILVAQTKAIGIGRIDALTRYGLFERGGQGNGWHDRTRRIPNGIVDYGTFTRVAVQVKRAAATVGILRTAGRV